MNSPEMRLPVVLRGKLTLPVIAAPMFLVSGPELVVAECLSGVVGAFPALNARAPESLDAWLTHIKTSLAAAQEADPERNIAPFAVNQIVHSGNDRLERDLETCIAHETPMIITSLGAPGKIVRRIHSYGGIVFHDVSTVRHAEKALEEGVDGLILVCAGAGGHAGTLSPFALFGEVRRFYDGPIALAGAIGTGAAILATQALGADLAYMGTRFIATTEARAVARYKEMIATASAADILYTPYFTGVSGNYLKPSIIDAGLDPDRLPLSENGGLKLDSSQLKAWRDVWGAGQGVGLISDILPVAEVVARLASEYQEAWTDFIGKTAKFTSSSTG